MPKCQEISAYIIMIVVHQRESRLGESKTIVPVLLGLVLLGTPLAQKRGLKLLEWLKNERQGRVGAHSGPQTGRSVGGAVGSRFDEEEIEKGKRMMRSLVKESLYKNMEIITQRANVGECSTIRRTLDSSSSISSKSLPF